METGLLKGRATPEGTARFAERFAELPGHFRRPDNLWLSTLGMGTRPGDPGGIDDISYRSTIDCAVERGINVFDTSISYRMMHSERNLGVALRRAIREGRVSRDELCVMSKCGYLTADTNFVRTRADLQHYLIRTYVEPGLVDVERLANGNHSLDAAFIADQIDRSRANLGLDTIDLYFIEDPEIHLRSRTPSEFHASMCGAIEALERAVAAGKIGGYGVSTWSGFFVPHTERGHLSIAELFGTILDVGGSDNHFRAISFPYSVAMGEAAGLPSQFGGGARPIGVLELLEGTGTAAFASTPLVRGRAALGLPDFLMGAFAGVKTPAQVALQFARSTPGVTSTLVGMRSVDHLEENVALCRVPPAAPEVIERLFAKARERPE